MTATKAPAKKAAATKRAPATRQTASRRRTKPAKPERRIEYIAELPLADIIPDEHNVRGDVGNVDDMARSIKAQGILQPLVVAAIPGPRGKVTYALIAGHRRWTGARKAGLVTVPAMVHHGLDEAERLEAQLTENLQRVDITPIAEARGFQRMLDLGRARTHGAVATAVGRSQPHVTKRLQLLTLPPADQDAVANGDLTIGAALALVPLVAHPTAYRHARQVTDQPDRFRTVVAAELRELEQAPKRDAARAEAERQGLKVREWPTGGSGWWSVTFKAHAGTEPIANLPEHYISTIRREDCKHQAAVISPDGTIVTICTNPKMHDPPKPKAKPRAAGPSRSMPDPGVALASAAMAKATASQKAADKERADREERDARRRELGQLAALRRGPAVAEVAAPAQLAAAAGLIPGLLGGGTIARRCLALIELLATAIITGDQYFPHAKAFRELGVEAHHEQPGDSGDWPAGILGWADQATGHEHTTRLVTAAAVLTVGEFDEFIDDLDPHAGTALYRLLEALGHQPTDVETAHLAALTGHTAGDVA